MYTQMKFMQPDVESAPYAATPTESLPNLASLNPTQIGIYANLQWKVNSGMNKAHRQTVKSQLVGQAQPTPRCTVCIHAYVPHALELE